MAIPKAVKNSYYSGGKPEIAMPPLDEKPPVLDAAEWSGSQQQEQQEVAQPEEQEEIVQEAADDSEDTDVVEDASDEIEEVAPKQSKEYNFKNLRDRAEKAERQNEELMKYVLESKRAEQPVKQQVAIVEPEDNDDFDFSVDDDALIEGKHAKKLVQELKKIKQQLKQSNAQSAESITEAKIKSQFPDFDAVVNSVTVGQLNAEYPEIAATLKDTKDLYSKATAAYKIMKKFGIYKDKTYDQDKAIAVKNSNKPKTVTSLNPQQGDSPLSKANAFANGMSKDLQAQLLREMSDARKRL